MRPAYWYCTVEANYRETHTVAELLDELTVGMGQTNRQTEGV